jgi:hypothetical protein
MADNTVISPASAGDTIRDKDRAGVKTQIVGLDLNVSGAEVLGTGDAINGLDVDVTRVQGTVTVDTELPAAAALTDATANPTVPLIGAGALLFNGTTWDRQRNNVNTTTGDSGAKTVSFNGAAQTNHNARGAYITILLGTVSGTTPTLQFALQYSPDGGTTWVGFGPAAGNLTATGQTGLLAIYPTNWSQAAGSAPANIASAATASLYMNAPLPRTWRITYTIGGTTPSFAISSVNVNYVL